jgi:ACDE family multidrug resistance protein
VSFKNNKNLAIIFSITLLAVMGVASITPAFPTIAKHFKIDITEIGLLITVFTIPGIFLAPILGMLADRLGRKTVLIPSLLLFSLAGVACAQTTDFDTLLIFRALQGIGAAPLGSLNVTLIGDLFTGNQRASAMGYNASVLSIGTASYPAIGGALALMNWHYIFYLPLLALPVAFIALYSLDAPKVQRKRDSKEYFQSILKVLSQKSLYSIFIINVFTFIILYGAYLTFLPSFLEENFAADSFTIGMVMSLMSITTAIMASQLGYFSRKLSHKTIITLSASNYAVALVLLAFSTSYFMIITAIIMFGIAHGLFIPTIQTLLAGFATKGERATIMSINSMVLRIGQSLGPITIALFFIDKNYMYVFLAAAGFAILIAFINLITKKYHQISQIE